MDFDSFYLAYYIILNDLYKLKILRNIDSKSLNNNIYCINI